jgi:hypothetical protein
MDRLPSRLLGLLFLGASVFLSLYAYRLLNLEVPVDSSTYPGKPLMPPLRMIGGVACLVMLALPSLLFGLKLL